MRAVSMAALGASVLALSAGLSGAALAGSSLNFDGVSVSANGAPLRAAPSTVPRPRAR
jgi:hypothetical protein